MGMNKINSEKAVELIRTQRLDWSLAATNYEALDRVKVKEIDLGKVHFKVQFNPARIVSSAAKVDARSIAERKCFLCRENRPSEQSGISYGEDYTILVNPFPIFPLHLTIPGNRHADQLIRPFFGDMLDLAKELDQFTIFYNGPKCGASAPDHMHFQAGNKGFMPLEKEWRNAASLIVRHGETEIWNFYDGMRTAFVLEGRTKAEILKSFTAIYDLLEVKADEPEPLMNKPEVKADEPEPMMNLLVGYENGKYTVLIFPRAKHRPACYSAEGEANLLISPASVDMGGVFITPREEDFNKITQEQLKSILSEVCLAPEKMNSIADKLKNAL